MQKETITIRRGEEKDLDAFFDLYWISSLEHIQYSGELDILKPKEQCREYIINRQREHLKDTNQIFFVAEDQTKIIGMATGHIGERDEANIYAIEKIGYVDELCVLSEYRKSGTGTRLLDALIQELHKSNIKFIGVGVAYNNTAHHFYTSQGFNIEGIWMIRRRNHQKENKNLETATDAEEKAYDPYGRGKASLPFIVKVKPESLMGEYIALHGLVPQNELPEHLRYKIPKDEIWIREDVYNNPARRDQILQGHEKYELELMETKGYTYKQAHFRAQLHEKVYKLEEELENLKKDLGLNPFEPVRLVDRKRAQNNKTENNQKSE